MKLQHYENLEDMVHQAKKVERQLERKHSYRKTYYYDSSSGKDKSKKEGSSPPKQQGSKFPSGKHVPNLALLLLLGVVQLNTLNAWVKVILHYIVQTRKPKF